MVDSAIIELSAAAAADTLNMQLLIDLGNAFKGMGDSYSAYQYYLEVDKRYPEHKEVHLLMAQIKADEGKYNEAIRICENSMSPINADLYYLLGKQLQQNSFGYEPRPQQKREKETDRCSSASNIYYSNL